MTVTVIKTAVPSSYPYTMLQYDTPLLWPSHYMLSFAFFYSRQTNLFISEKWQSYLHQLQICLVT